MMKNQISSVLIFMLVVLCAECASRKYDGKYDNVDIDSILKSDRLVDNYLNCLLDKGRCTPQAADMKEIISDALASDCEGCTDKQRDVGKKVIRHLLKHRRDRWDDLQAKYDPNHTYLTKYGDSLKADGIDI